MQSFRSSTHVSHDIPLLISPHYDFPHDHKWEFEGALERLMHDIKMFDRPDALDTSSLEGSGADWIEQYKPFIQDGQTIVCSPHKVFGPQSDDLVLQLRKRRIEQVILAGMSANPICESCSSKASRSRSWGTQRQRPRFPASMATKRQSPIFASSRAIRGARMKPFNGSSRFVKKYSIYLMDDPAPAGFRLAAQHPERVGALIVQNGNAYQQGLENDFWKPIKSYWQNRTQEQGDKLRSLLTLEATKSPYRHGVRHVETISPEPWGRWNDDRAPDPRLSRTACALLPITRPQGELRCPDRMPTTPIETRQ